MLQRLILLCLLFLPLHAIAQEEETAEFTSDLFGGQILDTAIVSSMSWWGLRGS